MPKLNKNLCALCAIMAISTPSNGETIQTQINKDPIPQAVQTTEKLPAARNKTSEVAWVVPTVSALIILTLAVDFLKKEVKKSSKSDEIIQKMMEQKREHDF